MGPVGKVEDRRLDGVLPVQSDVLQIRAAEAISWSIRFASQVIKSHS